jgi:hypothetical protein
MNQPTKQLVGRSIGVSVGWVESTPSPPPALLISLPRALCSVRGVAIG